MRSHFGLTIKIKQTIKQDDNRQRTTEKNVPNKYIKIRQI